MRKRESGLPKMKERKGKSRGKRSKGKNINGKRGSLRKFRLTLAYS